MLRYLEIVNKEIEKEAERLFQKGMVLEDKKAYEWIAMAVAIKHPLEEEEKLYEAFLNEGVLLTAREFHTMLRAINLEEKCKREYIAGQLARMTECFERFVDGEEEAAREVRHYVQNLVERDEFEKRMYFKAKYLLTALYIKKGEFTTDALHQVLASCMEGYCNNLLSRLFKCVAKKIKFEYGNHTKEVIEQTRIALEISQADGPESEMSDQVKQIEELQFKVQNYKDTLAMVQGLFDELKDSVEESAEYAKNTAVGEFFSTLNSPEYGSLLDNLLVVEESMNKLKTEKEGIPSQVIPLTIVFKQLLRFIRNYGIEPMEERHRKLFVFYKDIENMNYIGNPFTDDKEKKEVRVVAPGWKYKDIIISLPTVKEEVG